MTFLGGPRACIAFKFAEMEIKQILCALLLSFHFAESREKEVGWRVNGMLVPGWKWKAGAGANLNPNAMSKDGNGGVEDGEREPSVPLLVRRVREEDFVWS